jgi:protein phosphatase
VAHGTDIGRRREENQDSFGLIEGPGYKLFLVCDGMGGVKGGAMASNIAVTTIRERITEKHILNEHTLVEAVQAANAAIFEKGSQDSGLTGMGTTFVGIGFVGTSMLVGNVGDSRAYRIRNGVVEQLTEDHTLVRELVRSGAISEEQAEHHPVSHMLTRSLGPTPTIEVDCWVASDGPAQGDSYLLCSDGLYNMVGPEDILEILQTCTLESAVQELIELANLRGGSDNITVIIAEIGSEYPTPPPPIPEAEDLEQEVEPQDQAQVTTVELDEVILEDSQHTNGHNGLSDQGSSSVSTEAVMVEPLKNGEAEGDLHEHVSLRNLSAELAKKQVADKPIDEEPIPSDGPAPGPVENLVAANEADSAARRPPSWFVIGAVGLLAVMFGWIVRGALTKFSDPGQSAHVVPPSQRVAEVARVAVQEPAAVSGLTSNARPPSIGQELPSIDLLHNNDTGSDLTQDHGLSPEELARLVKRKASLQQQILILDEKIASFDRPFSGKAGQILADASRRTDEMKTELSQVRAEIDIATRRLAVWFGRRKRLLTTEPINLASEVSVISPVVKEKKEEFERATWAYLKEAEVLRYNPNDRDQEARVAELVRERKDSMRDLAEEVRRAIDREVADADRRISELTLRRDAVDNQLEELRREVEYVRVLTGGDPASRSVKQAELRRERASAAAELEELRNVVPE